MAAAGGNTMSAEFDIRWQDTVCHVRIDHDGTMTILNPPTDLEYDEAFAAMGGDPSPALVIMRQWQSDPITMITNHLPGFSNNDLNLLALDWARHVLPIYTRSQATIYPQRVAHTMAILRNASRTLVAGDVGRFGNVVARKDQIDISNYAALTSEWADRNFKDASDSESSKAWSAWNAIAALSSAIHGDTRRCADRAATAFARQNGPEEASDEFYAEYGKEQAWQVRRFLDVIKATRAQKQWPRLGATP
jgi:hypothetical protein